MTMRVYEFSKISGMSNKDVLKVLQGAGFEVETHMAVLTPEMKSCLERHSKGFQAKETVSVYEKPLEKKPVAPVLVHESFLVVEPMTVNEFAQRTERLVGDVILTLLKQKIIAPKNHVLTEKLVIQLAQHYGIQVKTAESREAVREIVHAQQQHTVVGAHEMRPPVVVVIGHVDHGKTTLLDYIRQTRVASREKGGITQHLGAYEVHMPHGTIVFLDTPGHEAFSLIRVRGMRVADIAILVVAADDGVMPQTIEAINKAKLVGLQVVVALNKIDKASSAQIDNTKRQLSQHGLMPEEWGGPIVFVPVSAKTGKGVQDLLDIIVLQSQLMDLVTDTTVPPRGFVLESKMETGRGVVATVICQHGVLRVGDFFICGATRGKVSSLVDSLGKRVQMVSPSIPVQVAGFEDAPQAGDYFEVVSAAVRQQRGRIVAAEIDTKVRQVSQENALNLIIKTDNASSKEALVGAIQKISGKAFRQFYVLQAGVGFVTESDVLLAADTKAMIYGLHAKLGAGVAALAQKNRVSIKLFDIIYKLIEDLEMVAEQGKPVKKVTKKIGEAIVLKVFDIKSLGIVAGAQIKSGRFSRDGKVIVWRGKYKVGEGSIKSLQRDKKSVKEVHAGFECAFMVDGFNEWQAEDRVECMLEVVEGE